MFNIYLNFIDWVNHIVAVIFLLFLSCDYCNSDCSQNNKIKIPLIKNFTNKMKPELIYNIKHYY